MDSDRDLSQTRRAKVLLDLPGFSAVFMASNGSIARMNTVHPRAFVAFKRWMSTQSGREATKRLRSAPQADAVKELLDRYLPNI